MDLSRPIPCLRRPSQRNGLLSNMRFDECLLGAAARLEISFENPGALTCCMRDSMHAAGTTSHLRCKLAETAGLNNMGGNKVDLNAAGSGAETMVETATRGYQNNFPILSGLKFLSLP